MADMTYADLTSMDYGDLAGRTYALQTSGAGDTCLDDAAIAVIKSGINALAASVATVQADVTAIKSRMPTSGTVSTLTVSDIPTVDLSTIAASLATVTALLGRWNVYGDTLTTIDSEGNTLQAYALTRDTQGNIIGIEEATP